MGQTDGKQSEEITYEYIYIYNQLGVLLNAGK